MAQSFDFIVVGKGMMGAAAARHLSVAGAHVALVGPDEPQDWASHAGVFSSHYDNGRITRTIDTDPVWARLAQCSIARYRQIETESGTPFYTESGCLIAAPAPGGGGDHLDRVIAARDRLGVAAPLLSGADLSGRFAWFRFPAGHAGIYEAHGAGHIDPRALVRAQVRCAQNAGCTVIEREVVGVSDRVSHVDVTVEGGDFYRAERVIVAAGGFSIAKALLPLPLDLVVKARTVVFAEVAADALEAFAGMPSLIVSAATQDQSYYLLPPVRYPDGKFYIKIGGDPSDIVLDSEAAVRTWFRGPADRAAAGHLRAVLAGVMPDFRPVATHAKPCVTTFTRHGYPYIGYAGSQRLVALTGGNGAAAKSSDEIGRLGAGLALAGTLDAPGYDTDFAVCFR